MSFFDYPTSEQQAPPPSQVLLPDATEAEWTALLEFTTAGRLEVGSVVGELSFFDGGPRSAAVRAVTPVALAELTAADFEVLRKRHPDLACRLLADLGRILAGRLRRAET